MNGLEIRRQLVHFSGVSISFLTLFADARSLGLVCLLGVFVLLFLSAKARKGLNTKESAEKFVHEVILSVERKGFIPFEGAIMYLLGASISLILLPSYAMIGIMVLAVGDSISTLVGVHKGFHKLHFNRNKSYEGLLAGFISSAAFCSLFFPITTAVSASLVGMLTESLPLSLNDNVSVPIAASVAASML